MNYEAFFNCMFECADMWVDSIDGNDYATFLKGVWDASKAASGHKRIGAVGMWRAAKSLLGAPKLLYEGGGYDMQNFEERKRVANHAVKEILKIVDNHSNNGKITVTEMDGYLSNTAFGSFSNWMTKLNRRNWARFDKDKDGRIDKHELYDAMIAFLISDGYGRDLCESSYGGDDGDDQTTKWKPGTSKISKSGSNDADPPLSARHVGAPNSARAPAAQGAPAEESKSSGKGMWWLHMQNLASCIQTIDSFIPADDSRGKLAMRPSNYLQGSLCLNEIQMSKAEQAFNKYDVSGDGCLQISELYMALGMCNLTMTPEALQAHVEEEFSKFDKDDSGWISLNEFLHLYNALFLDEVSMEDFLG